LFEKCLLTRIIPYLGAHNVIPVHQLGFHQNHVAIEQVNRITLGISTAFEHREYCSAIFLDVSQAFGQIWLESLMHKIKTHLPDYIHKLLGSYLYNRVFAVRCNTTTSDDYIIEAEVPPGSALGPSPFLLYTANIPSKEQLTTSTFADNTAILSRSRCPGRATTPLANHLLIVEMWLSAWRIKVNEQKCKWQTRPPLALNSTQIPKF